jgi:hypothetical protein
MDFGNLKFWDIGLIKMAVLCGSLFLVSVWQGFADWVINTHWAWFLAACLMFSIKPLIALFKRD